MNQSSGRVQQPRPAALSAPPKEADAPIKFQGLIKE